MISHIRAYWTRARITSALLWTTVCDYSNRLATSFYAPIATRHRYSGIAVVICDNPYTNLLLAALLEADYVRLESVLESVSVRAGQAIHASGSRGSYGYFPVSGLVSLVGFTSNNDAMYLAEIGKEGLVGAWYLLGPEEMPFQCVALTAVRAYRIPIDTLTAGIAGNPAFWKSLLMYNELLMIQMAQSAICCRRHTAEQKLCKLLLSSVDRLTSNELELTQQFIANILGLRREEITHAARRLQEARLLEYNRGRIVVINRTGLESRACECYRIVRAGLERLLPATLAC